MLDRRQFIASLAGSAFLVRGRTVVANGLARVGALTSVVEKQILEDPDVAFSTLRSIGYTEIEQGTLSSLRLDAYAFRDLLKKYRLTAPSRVFTDVMLKGDFSLVLREADVAGSDTVIYAALPPAERGHLDSYKRLIDRLNNAARQAKAHGLRLGMHSESWDVQPVDGGIVPLDS